ncbi:probable membrane-associated kinase regulator 1 [Helianthus annuus]|uniref:probable membrane-associated kinase regulator 1 n=1 Tax=Helianthus annuus TaxID=4232 RepID=UPI000B900B6A|nr:probable membrane-associated kinase regulator 1 [Helianthus annuus]
MGIHKQTSHTLPSTPIHHHSSDFKFTVSLSPPDSTATNLRPADELFYNGQLLPLQLSPRNSMVCNLSDYHSSLSSGSSATEDGDHPPHKLFHSNQKKVPISKQFSLKKFSSVFRKETKPASPTDFATVSLKEKIRKYMKKLSKFHTPQMVKREDIISYSFSGNLRFLTRTSCVSSCPSTMPSSPYHCQKNVISSDTNRISSSTEELQCAMQEILEHSVNKQLLDKSLMIL